MSTSTSVNIKDNKDASEKPDESNNNVAKKQYRSTEDKKLDALLVVKKGLARLEDARKEIAKTLSELKGPQPQSIRDLQRVVLPVMEFIMTQELPNAMKNVGSVPGAAYVHKSNEAKANLAARTDHRKRKIKSIGFRRLENTLREQQQQQQVEGQPRAQQTQKRPPLPTQNGTGQPLKGVPPRRMKQPFKMPRLPLPADGRTYTAEEAVLLLTRLQRHQRRKVIEKWVDGGLITVGVSAVYRRLKAHASGIPIRPFGEHGRPTLLEEETIKEMALDLNRKYGKSLTSSIVKKELVARQIRTVEASGRVPLNMTVPSKTSISNYKAKISEAIIKYAGT